MNRAADPCRYGCKDPLACSFPHPGCAHCSAIRHAAGGRGTSPGVHTGPGWKAPAPVGRPETPAEAAPAPFPAVTHAGAVLARSEALYRARRWADLERLGTMEDRDTWRTITAAVRGIR